MQRKIELPETTYYVTTTYDSSTGQSKETLKRRKYSKIKFYTFALRWFLKNHKWDNSRQKHKRMHEDFERRLQGKPCRYL